jgi:hypothetical protein
MDIQTLKACQIQIRTDSLSMIVPDPCEWHHEVLALQMSILGKWNTCTSPADFEWWAMNCH